MSLSTVSFDSRTPINRLRRCQLWSIAKRLNIPFAPGATKDAMVALLEGHGIDVLAADTGIKWRAVHGQDEHGHPHTEVEPVVPEHATARKQIDYDAEIEKRAKAAEDALKASQENEQAQSERIASLERMVATLVDRIDRKAPMALSYEEALPWQLKREIERRELKHVTGMTKVDMVAVLRADDENAARRGQ